VWLALAMLFSVLFRSPATAVLSAFGLWFFLTVLWPPLAPHIVGIFINTPISTADDLLGQLAIVQGFSRVSPGTLFGEIVTVVLDPEVGSTQQPLLASLNLRLVDGSIGGNLPLMQSLMIVWPQIVALIASTIVLFVISYVIFQRQEVRA